MLSAARLLAATGHSWPTFLAVRRVKCRQYEKKYWVSFDSYLFDLCMQYDADSDAHQHPQAEFGLVHCVPLVQQG